MADPDPLHALSPLDGRYAAKLAPMRSLWSEAAFMRHRVRVEVEWLIALSDAGLPELAPFSEQSRAALQAVVDGFSDADAQAIKTEERRTNHDVKAVEYFLKKRLAGDAEVNAAAEFIISPARRKTSTTSRMPSCCAPRATRCCCLPSTASSSP
jgi:adenylosuccinate lyase